MAGHDWAGVEVFVFYIYFIGLVIGSIVALLRYGANQKLTFFEALAPAFVWPLALLKESWKYLRK
jgi:hypothetical protein